VMQPAGSPSWHCSSQQSCLMPCPCTPQLQISCSPGAALLLGLQARARCHSTRPATPAQDPKH
jgi:hypothetical protein